MFDFAWSQIMLIGIVALIAIGPKDLPVAMKAIAGMVKKARGLAAEFQGQVDELMKDSDLAEVRRGLNEIRGFDLKGVVKRTVDADGTLGRTFSEPLIPDPPPASTPAAEPAAPGTTGEATAAGGPIPESAIPGAPPSEGSGAAPVRDYPAFIPPEFADQCEEPPAFIPPGIRPPAAYYYSAPPGRI